MRDWEALVEQHLTGLALEPTERAEVIAELAAHLADTYERLRAQGVPEEIAAQQAMREVPDWKELRLRICAAKEMEDQMPNRVRQVWFPGFLTLTFSSFLLMVLQKNGLQPRIVTWEGVDTILVYVPWLLMLPLLGALGAYISARAGGSTRAILFGGVFPVLAMVACFFVALPFSLVIDRNVAFHFKMQGFLNAFVGWVLVPGLALLLGALPIQILHARLESHRAADV